MQNKLNADQIMALLSPEDQELARLDLVALGMFTVTCDHRGARRVDPGLVRVPSAPSNVIGPPGIVWRDARVKEKEKSVLRWGEIVRQMNTDPMLAVWSSTWRWDHNKLPIWRKTDPGAR